MNALPKVDSSHTYWDAVGRRWHASRASPWRAFTDHQQLELIRAWLPFAGDALASGLGPELRHRSLLKTDLFDEVAHQGLVPALLRAGLSVSAVDLSPWIVAEALERNPGLQACQADVRCLPFPEGRFDAVFSGSTLDHLDSAEAIGSALDELVRVLRPGGLLILTMDNPTHPLIRLRNGRTLALWRRLGLVPYQVGMTLAHRPLIQAVAAAGLRVLDTRAVQHCPRVLAVGIAGPLSRLPPAVHGAYLRVLDRFEWLARLPSRWFTAHYTAVLAQKPWGP